MKHFNILNACKSLLKNDLLLFILVYVITTLYTTQFSNILIEMLSNKITGDMLLTSQLISMAILQFLLFFILNAVIIKNNIVNLLNDNIIKFFTPIYLMIAYQVVIFIGYAICAGLGEFKYSGYIMNFRFVLLTYVGLAFVRDVHTLKNIEYNIDYKKLYEQQISKDSETIKTLKNQNTELISLMQQLKSKEELNALNKFKNTSAEIQKKKNKLIV